MASAVSNNDNNYTNLSRSELINKYYIYYSSIL